MHSQTEFTKFRKHPVTPQAVRPSAAKNFTIQQSKADYEMDIQTTRHIQLIDTTASLNTEIARVGIETDMAMVYSPHTTTAIIINENEPGLTEDILKLLNLMVPQERYAHDRIDNNTRSHLQAVVLGNNVCMPVENGDLALGTRQSVFFVELDGPRNHKLAVRIVSTCQ